MVAMQINFAVLSQITQMLSMAPNFFHAATLNIILII